ncbi:hypothetical protein CJD36_019990 [Flavipsychrobacter stenotrophus]|uniref:Uncharacterized protein n=1 Tax=Flavipsychrobacter stenotrophus TaxID=2077091 RepID=A0A2S7SSB2_9BACT|nr:hypothetical protein [Flavipsychrobacter stenotrophus]PQJ09521.1 hypothetical protein CJD36_019990 [Flavipsychrobacter stenotrophus]
MKEVKFTSFEAACAHLKIGTELPDVSMLPTEEQKGVIAQYKLQILVKANNDGWKANYAERSQYKYFPWFEYVPGSGWVLDGYVGGYACTYVGARLALKTSALAMEMGGTFIDLYRDLLGEGE